jgi:shikimate kinase
MEKDILIWNELEKSDLNWTSPVSDVRAAIPNTEASRTIVIGGVPGSGKSSLLLYLRKHGIAAFDGDLLFVYAYAMFNGLDDKLTLGEIASDPKVWDDVRTDEFNELIYSIARKFAVVGGIRDVARKIAEAGGLLVHLNPNHEKYSQYLYHRDHDPEVERNHRPHKIMTQEELDQEANDQASTTVIFDHDYTDADWKRFQSEFVGESTTNDPSVFDDEDTPIII